MDTTALIASIIRDLPDSIAVLDAAGTILAVNASWERFAAANGVHRVADVGPGVNYLAVCREAADAGDDIAGDIERGIRQVLSGEWQTYSSEYPCHSSSIERWFDLRATALAGGMTGAVLCHTNITVEWRARRLLQLPSHSAAAQQAQIVTMCSGCKRIRNAQQHWQTIEDWLFAQHGERFSHGLCDECVERLYPGVLAEVKLHGDAD